MSTTQRMVRAYRACLRAAASAPLPYVRASLRENIRVGFRGGRALVPPNEVEHAVREAEIVAETLRQLLALPEAELALLFRKGEVEGGAWPPADAADRGLSSTSEEEK